MSATDTLTQLRKRTVERIEALGPRRNCLIGIARSAMFSAVVAAVAVAALPAFAVAAGARATATGACSSQAPAATTSFVFPSRQIGCCSPVWLHSYKGPVCCLSSRAVLRGARCCDVSSRVMGGFTISCPIPVFLPVGHPIAGLAPDPMPAPAPIVLHRGGADPSRCYQREVGRYGVVIPPLPCPRDRVRNGTLYLRASSPAISGRKEQGWDASTPSSQKLVFPEGLSARRSATTKSRRGRSRASGMSTPPR